MGGIRSEFNTERAGKFVKFGGIIINVKLRMKQGGIWLKPFCPPHLSVSVVFCACVFVLCTSQPTMFLVSRETLLSMIHFQLRLYSL